MPTDSKIIHPNWKIISTDDIGYPYDRRMVWDDLRFPAFGRKLETAAGHLAYNNAELGVDFDDSSRYHDLDMIGMVAQFPHNKALGTNARPHIHFPQNQNQIPNALLKYRFYNNGDLVPATWMLLAPSGVAFSWVSEVLMQILIYPEIDLSGETGVSGILDMKLFRDTANTSTEFAGVDNYSGDWMIKEFDLHYKINQMGSRQEFYK